MYKTLIYWKDLHNSVSLMRNSALTQPVQQLNNELMAFVDRSTLRALIDWLIEEFIRRNLHGNENKYSLITVQIH